MEWKLTADKDWLKLEKQFSWVADMWNVPQDPVHHAEGNVAIHTQLVLEQLQQSSDYRELNRQRQELLWAAALLRKTIYLIGRRKGKGQFAWSCAEGGTDST